MREYPCPYHRSTHKRLRLHYGEEYGVKIESQAGKGTTVHLAVKIGG